MANTNKPNVTETNCSEAEQVANGNSVGNGDRTFVVKAVDIGNDADVVNNAVAQIKQNNKKHKLKVLFIVLFIVAMAAIIAYTAVSDFTGESVNTGDIAKMIGDNWYYLFVLLGLFALTLLLESLKIFVMIKKTTGKFKLGTALNCAVLGKFYDFVTPLGSGGQPFQIYYLAKHDVDSGAAGAIPIGSLFLTQFSFVLCAIVAFCVGVPNEIVPLTIRILAYCGAAFYIAVPLFLVVFSFMPKAGHKVIAWGVKVLTKLKICKNPDKWIAKGNAAIDNNKHNMAILFKSKSVLILGTILALLLNIAQCSMPYFALLLFKDVLLQYNWVPSWELWFEVLRITFFIYCAITFIPTPGNSGAADGTFYGLFRTVLISAAGASFTCMMVWRVFSFYLYLLVGLIVVIGIKIFDKSKSVKLLDPSY